MPLPNSDRAVVGMAKLTKYCLNADHERGGHKARVFASMLGITPANADELRQELLAAVRSIDAMYKGTTEYGTYYQIDFVMENRRGTAPIRSGWIIRHGEDFPRLTSCYINI